MGFLPGIKVGHWTDEQAATGCTVILCPQGAVAGVDVRGSAPGTRETDLLRPVNLVQKVHAILLSGGSAFGLDAASGVMKFLEEGGHGFDTIVAKVPIVPAAVLFDLSIGNPKVRPGAAEGYSACVSAIEEAGEGSIGAGTGATVGKILGMERATKSGLGITSQRVGKLMVMALVVVNAFGDVIDPQSGKTLAGPRGDEGFLNTVELLKQLPPQSPFTSHTTLGVVATNARLNKEQANKLAQMAQDGLSRVIRPCHTMFDGDVIFSLSLGQEEGDINLIGSIAAELVAQAIIRAINQARGVAGIPAIKELRWST